MSTIIARRFAKRIGAERAENFAWQTRVQGPSIRWGRAGAKGPAFWVETFLHHCQASRGTEVIFVPDLEHTLLRVPRKPVWRGHSCLRPLNSDTGIDSGLVLFERRSRAIYRSATLGYTPLPPVFWNLWVRARLPSKSLRNKDLYAKYSGQRS